MMSTIVLASNNAGKLAEFSALVTPLGVELVPQAQLGVTEANEPYATFIENALAKARHASAHTGLPALADDSGLCVRALNNAPGVYSARYAQRHQAGRGDEANNAYLLRQLQNVDPDQRQACFVAVLVYVRHATDPLPLIAQGLWWGQIAPQAAGPHGFGYDPIFYIPALGRTAAELSAAEKNQHSHRAQALRTLLTDLTPLYRS